MHSESPSRVENEKELLCNFIPLFTNKNKMMALCKPACDALLWLGTFNGLNSIDHRVMRESKIAVSSLGQKKRRWINEERTAVKHSRRQPHRWHGRPQRPRQNVHIQAHHKYFNNWKHRFLINGHHTLKREIFRISPLPIEFNIPAPVRSTQLFINETGKKFVDRWYSNNLFVLCFVRDFRCDWDRKNNN